MNLLKGKDNQAFSYLYDNYAGALYGVVKQIVTDAETGNDVLQEVFVSIWRKIDSYDETKGRLFTWMLNIARNAAIDKTRSKNYQQSMRQQPLENHELSHPVVLSAAAGRPMNRAVGAFVKLVRAREWGGAAA